MIPLDNVITPMPLSLKRFTEKMNRFGAEGESFLFLIDFLMKTPEIYKLDEVPGGIKFCTLELSNCTPPRYKPGFARWEKYPVSFSHYRKAFKKVQTNISAGNSYLLNLTFPTRLSTDLTLEDIYRMSSAKYKLLYHNKFVVFSPETFVRISEGRISSCPMKGTIDASVPDAENVILNDNKEMAEHNTIVDLIRNDLSMVSRNVTVKKYRYVDRIKTAGRDLMQVSSEITGELGEGYESNLGSIITGMLPAGSISGAPKRETMRIIADCENYDRGWYTGIFGVFDGKTLDSCVMIRYIESISGQLFFKSGGGITGMSDARSEYDELIAKVNVAVG
jgi:para-aminobenzoate synthetase component 1